MSENKHRPSWSRRDFLKTLGALGLAYLPSCRRAEEYLISFNEGTEDGGFGNVYATCLPHEGGSLPVTVVCHDGYPTLIQPNPQYASRSGISARDQASLLNLYDPHRCRKILFHGKPTNKGEWEGAFAAWAQQCTGKGKPAFLFGATPSAVRMQMLDEICRRNPNVRFFEYAPFSSGNSQKALTRMIQPGATFRIDFAETRVLLSVGCDFLGDEPMGRLTDFAVSRTPEGENYARIPSHPDKLTWLAVAEESPSLTGGMADMLISCPNGQEAFIAELQTALLSLAHESGVVTGIPLPSLTVRSEIEDCARRLWRYRGEALILIGDSLSADAHEIVFSLNVLLQATGGALHFLQGQENKAESLADLTAALRRQEIDTLFICTPNDPAAEDADFAEALRQSRTETVRLCLYEDETAHASSWVLPGTHPLEEWGLDHDAEGHLCLRRPVILPLYNGISEIELLAGLLSSRGQLCTADNTPDHTSPAAKRVRKAFLQLSSSLARGKEQAWEDILQKGFTDKGFPAIHQVPPLSFPAISYPPVRANGHIPIRFCPDAIFRMPADCRNPWLNELTHPLTGVTGEATARASLPSLKAGELRLLCLSHPSLPPLIIPVIGDPLEHRCNGGYHITLPFLANGKTNTYAWAKITSLPHEAIRLLPLDRPLVYTPVTLCREGDEPDMVRPAAPDLTQGEKPSPDLSVCRDTHHQWGMAIDLNLCIGCNACLIACRAENNIPVVGKRELLRGRDLQWIRIDRYLCQNARRVSIPVSCQHCEAAPCESVCPVNATVHTDDGLSAMVYPRCWGTRYCAANCPYEARRFNFFDYARASADETRRRNNPRVTVRSRGVMEKCSYCVQRIRETISREKKEKALAVLGNAPEYTWNDDDLRLPPNAVQTACQLACPMGAISFGNILPHKTPDRVFMAQSSPRTVRLLEERGTRPRTAYLKRTQPPCP